MGDKTGISWCDATANVIVGCSMKSDGCKNCYAQRLAGTRLRHLPVYEGTTKPSIGGPEWTGVVNFHPGNIEKMMRWDRPRRIFLTAVSDPFHDALTNEDIAALFGFMAARPRHTFQVLTKRPERFAPWFAWLRASAAVRPDKHYMNADLHVPIDLRMRAVLAEHARAKALALGVKVDFTRSAAGGPWPLPNVELMVSVEDQKTANKRIPLLLQPGIAAVRGISLEPMLEAVDLDPCMCEFCGKFAGDEGTVTAEDGTPWCGSCEAEMSYGHWLGPNKQVDVVIVGGESGPGARPFDLAWARDVIRDCRDAGTLVFFKQAGANPLLDGASLNLASSKGGDLAELPEEFRVQELPQRQAR